jgi:hypothetical protein
MSQILVSFSDYQESRYFPELLYLSCKDVKQMEVKADFIQCKVSHDQHFMITLCCLLSTQSYSF